MAILVGSLTAANATQRIAGFEQAIAGTSIQVVQKVNDNLSASTAQSDAETILANNPDVNGLYGVYSYDGPALAQAVQSAKKTGQVSIVSDDSDAQTLCVHQFQRRSAAPWSRCRTSRATPAPSSSPRRRCLATPPRMAIIKPYLVIGRLHPLLRRRPRYQRLTSAAYTSLHHPLGIG